MTFSVTVSAGNNARFWNVPRDARAWRHGARDREQVLAREGDASRRRVVQPAQAVEQRRLAGAVRTDQGADLALLDLEREVCEREDPAELDSHVLDSQQSHDAV